MSARRMQVSGAVTVAALAAVGAAQLYAQRPRAMSAAPGTLLATPDAQLHAAARGRGPLVLFESALATPCTAWTHVVGALEGEFATLCYDRAGNGWSARGPAVDAAASTARALAVLDAVDDGEVIVVGHSIGGLLAIMVAATAPERVRGLVLVDSSHPDQLQRSSAQRDGRLLVAQGLHSMLAKTRWRRDIPEAEFGAIADLPSGVRETTLALLNSPHPWRGALDELAAWEPGWADAARSATLRPDLPIAVVTAGEQARIDPKHRELQVELANLSSCSVHDIVEGTAHDELVLAAEPARRVVDAIRWVDRQSADAGRRRP